mgnify:FL=1
MYEFLQKATRGMKFTFEWYNDEQIYVVFQ